MCQIPRNAAINADRRGEAVVSPIPGVVFTGGWDGSALIATAAPGPTSSGHEPSNFKLYLEVSSATQSDE
jgi:hypothetical protein